VKAFQLKQISGEEHSQGIIALVHQREGTFNANLIQSANLIIACDRVSDPGNLGTIIRNCDWFGVDMILLNQGCVSIYNEKVVRSTAGSIFHLNIFEDTNFCEMFLNLKSNSFKILAAALEGESINSEKVTNKSVILLGSEAHGIDPQLLKQANKVLSIPRYGKAESLNVGVACGIFLAHWRNQFI
jgi:TrmH family RNA methyltransferase